MIIGGQKRITTVAELVVPFMAIAYILGSLVIMCIYFDQIPQAFAEVFREAFLRRLLLAVLLVSR